MTYDEAKLLKKIEALLDVRHDAMMAKITDLSQRVKRLEQFGPTGMATKQDIEELKSMLNDDMFAMNEDVGLLKRRVARLERSTFGVRHRH